MRGMLRRPAVGGATLLLAITIAAQSTVPTSASWNDLEWVNAPVGTLTCEEAFRGTGQGRVLSGSLLGIDLDDVVEASGVEVVNDGAGAQPIPASANPVPGNSDAFADPLNVAALSLISADLGRGALKLPLDTSTGVLGQYAAASADGRAQGASGYVTETGAIGLDTGSGYPEFARVNLSDLLASLNYDLGTLAPGIADASLEVGALAGRAELDACALSWHGRIDDALRRDYLISGLAAEAEVPAVGALSRGVATHVDNLESVTVGLGGDSDVLAGITGGIAGLVDNLLGANPLLEVSLGSVHVNGLTATVDLRELTALVSAPFGDPEGVLLVDPLSSQVQIDLAALLGAAYPDSYASGLNELPPNTDLLAEPGAAQILTAALTRALDAWIVQVSDALLAAVNGIELDVDLTVALRLRVLFIPVPLAEIEVGVAGPLTDLETAASLNVLDLSLLSNAINRLLDGILAGLLSGAGGIVAGAVDGAVGGLRTLPPALTELTGPAIDGVAQLYSALFLDELVTLQVNAQNRAADGSLGPVGWDFLPDGRYDVAALHVGVAGPVGTQGVDLFLGRGSVGPADFIEGPHPD